MYLGLAFVGLGARECEAYGRKIEPDMYESPAFFIFKRVFGFIYRKQLHWVSGLDPDEVSTLQRCTPDRN